MVALVAGHQFEGVASDRKCVHDWCGKYWWFVKTATEDDLGKPEKACKPNLTSSELSEIRAEIEREEKLQSIMVGKW